MRSTKKNNGRGKYRLRKILSYTLVGALRDIRHPLVDVYEIKVALERRAFNDCINQCMRDFYKHSRLIERSLNYDRNFSPHLKVEIEDKVVMVYEKHEHFSMKPARHTNIW